MSLGWLAPVLVLLGAWSCGRESDLDRAIDGGVGRRVSRAPGARPHPWVELASQAPGNDSLLSWPADLCYSATGLVVADFGRSQVVSFDTVGRVQWAFGRRGAGPAEFQRISTVACAPSGRRVLVADVGLARVTMLDDAGRLLAVARGPAMPQGIPYYGEFAVYDDGDYAYSWLGSEVGPYYAAQDWDTSSVAARFRLDGAPALRFGRPIPFRDPAVTRAFNRAALALDGDTLWLLAQGPALLRAFDRAGRETRRIPLPVYHRGIDPIVEVSAGRLPGGYRRNRAHYYPNVGDIAIAAPGRFLLLRYTDWEQRRRGSEATGSIEFWPRSSIEVLDGAGRVRCRVEVPGRGLRLAARGHRAALITERFETGEHVVLHAPAPAC